MQFTRILLSIVFVLFTSTAQAAKPDKTLVCHVGNEYGPEDQVYDPTCEPDEFYDCSADAGKVDLILVSAKAKHVGNEAHTFVDGTGYPWEDYYPVDGIGDDPADFEEGDVVGIDQGCELAEESCPCWTADELAAIDGILHDGTEADNLECRVNSGWDQITEYAGPGYIRAQVSPLGQICAYEVWNMPGIGGIYRQASVNAWTLTPDELAVCISQIGEQKALLQQPPLLFGF